MNNIRKGSMNPTPLEYSWLSTHPTEMKLVIFVLFTIIIMIVGIMMICLTYPIPTGKNCSFILKSLARNPFGNDSRPHSIAIADFNNDGLLDIVVPNFGMDNIGIFLRHASGTFTNQIVYSTGLDSTPYAVVVNDFNHDQQLDIAVTNFDSHSIGIFLGIGNGIFKPQTTISTGSSRPRSIAVGDFNNDTQPDVAVVNYGTYTLGIFLQDTNGSFANQRTFSTGYDSDPYSLAVGDLNDDDKLDIVVANYGTNNIGVFLGHGDGTFAIQIIFSTGIHSHSYSIAIGHLNNDTYLDIVVANYGRNNVGVLIGYGNGTLAIPTTYSTGNYSLPLSVAIADFDNDNKLDIAVANYDTDSVVILFGDGNGNFSEQIQSFYNGSNFNPHSIAIGDFNADNRSDIVVVNYDFNHVDVILNSKNFSFHSQITYSTDADSKPSSIVIADLNNDNYRDIIVANSEGNNIMMFFGYGDGTFSDGISFSTGHHSSPCSVAISDFNNDGQLDIVVTNYLAYNIAVFLGDGHGAFLYQYIFSSGNDSNPLAIAIGDFNSDNQSDIVVANYGADNLGVFLGYGNGTFADQVTYSTGSGSGPNSVVIGDFNKDSRLDIVVASSGTNNVGVFLGHGDGTFSNQTIYSTANNSKPSSIAVADFDNDNRSDIIVVNYGTGTISLFLGHDNGILSNEIILLTGANSGPWSITTGDFNRDHRLDFVVANRWSDSLGVFIGYGNGSFSNQTICSTGSRSSPYSVAVDDLNNDGRLDIVVADMDTNNIGIFIGYGNGNFTTQNTKPTVTTSNPCSVAVGDFNNDSRLDITVANFWSNNIGIFLGDGHGSFSNQVTYHTGTGSAPSSIAVGDFNNDSRLDIVVANRYTYNIGVLLGYGDGTLTNQTTFPTGDGSQPSALAVTDLNNDDRLDIVVANFGTDHVGIFLGYGNGTFASQTIYSTGSGFSLTSIAIGDFNNDDRLDIVVTNWNPFATVGLFLGYGNGSFSSQTTYPTGRNSGPANVVIGDLNNDGRLDIVVTLNHVFGITIFLGDGNGTFFHQSTFLIGSSSSPYACALGDVNNDHQLDIVITDSQNEDIVVLLGDGHGSFSNRTSYSTGIRSDPVSVAFGDFNTDGILDIVVANPDTDTIGIFLGFSYVNGVRESICSTGSSPQPRAIAVGDFNKDSRLDMVMTNYGLDNVEVFLQDTNNTFSMQIMVSTGVLSLPTSVAIGDLNSDNQLDIIVANSGGENIGILYGYGNGTFTNQTTFSAGSNFIPQSVAVGDFNNDKKLDILVAESDTHSVMTLLRYDPGAFGNKTMYSTGADSLPTWVAVGDFNNDGWMDIVVTNSNSDNVGVFLGQGNATFSNQTTYSTGSGSLPQCIAIADLNKDGHLDIIVCNSLNATIGIFLGFSNGTFSDQTTFPTGKNSDPNAIAIGDLNKDDRLDIVVVNNKGFNVGIFLANDTGTFFNLINYSTGNGSYPCSVALGDFNNDDRLDIVVANTNGGNVGVFIGYGNGTFSAMMPYSTGSSSAPVSVAVGDFNNDGRLDITVANSHTDNVGLLFGIGNGTFSNQTTYSTGNGSAPNFLAIGDFNNDNQLDIAIVTLGTNSFKVLLACSNGTFFSPLNYFVADGSPPHSIAVADFNNDNRLDIMVTSIFTNEFGVFLGYASESFLFAPPTSTGSLSQPTSIVVGHFNHDTRLDVVVANNGTDNVMVLFGSGYGTFVNQTIYSTGNDSNPCGVAVGDFNNDSRLDIVVANSGANNIGIFLNNGSGIFSTQMIHSIGKDSQPYSVAVLDFDNDTRLDVAVANYASDSIIVLFGDGNGSFPKQAMFDTGFDSHPFSLAVGDVNNDHLCDIISSNNGYGNIDILLKEC